MMYLRPEVPDFVIQDMKKMNLVISYSNTNGVALHRRVKEVIFGDHKNQRLF